MSENPLKCLICYDEPTEENPILKCETCDVSVHALCYGIKNKKEFKCSPCCEKVSNDICCALCDRPGGAMKKTTEPLKWVHVICVFFAKKSEFVCNESMEPIDISRVRMNKKLECTFCKDKFNCFKCATRLCKNGLHASCAIANGTIEERDGENDEISFFGYCSTECYSKVSKKRLSSENINSVMAAKAKKVLQSKARKENAKWIVDKNTTKTLEGKQ